MPQTSSTNQPHYPTWQLMGGAPLDGFLDPRTIPPLRCFYLKSIGCFQIGTGSQVCKQLPGAAQAPIKHSRRPIRPAGCLGHQKGRRRCSLPSRLPSPCGLASDSSLKAGELTRRTKLGDSWLTETFALLRLTADSGERMSGGGAQAGGSQRPPHPRFRAAPSAPLRLRERVPGALRILRRERNDQLCAAFQMPSGSISWLS